MTLKPDNYPNLNSVNPESGLSIGINDIDGMWIPPNQLAIHLMN
jgi:hypothetical protein